MRVTVCCFGKKMENTGFDFWHPRRQRGLNLIGEAKRRLAVEQKAFDLLQCEMLTPLEAFLSYLLLGRRCRKKVLVLHDRLFRRGVLSVLRRLPSYLLLGLDLALYDKIIVPSDGLRGFFTGLYRPVSSHKFSTIPNGAPVVGGVRKDQQHGSRYGVPQGYCTAVFFGNLGFGPNLDAANYLAKWSHVICRSFAKVTGRPLRIVIAGKGSEELGPTRYVVRLGFVDDLFELLSAVDVAILPHPASHSGPHVKTLYCLAAGLPVVTTRDGMKDMPGLQPGRQCLLFDLSDPSSAAIAAGRIVRNVELRNRLIRNGLEYSSNWPWSRAAKIQLSVYQSLFC